MKLPGYIDYLKCHWLTKRHGWFGNHGSREEVTKATIVYDSNVYSSFALKYLPNKFGWRLSKGKNNVSAIMVILQLLNACTYKKRIIFRCKASPFLLNLYNFKNHYHLYNNAFNPGEIYVPSNKLVDQREILTRSLAIDSSAVFIVDSLKVATLSQSIGLYFRWHRLLNGYLIGFMLETKKTVATGKY